jgi:hypothetical protein
MPARTITAGLSANTADSPKSGRTPPPLRVEVAASLRHHAQPDPMPAGRVAGPSWGFRHEDALSRIRPVIFGAPRCARVAP